MAEEVSLSVALEDDYSPAAEAIAESSKSVVKAMAEVEKAAAKEAKAFSKVEEEAGAVVEATEAMVKAMGEVEKATAKKARATEKADRVAARSAKAKAREESKAEAQAIKESVKAGKVKAREESKAQSRADRERKAQERAATKAAEKKAREEAKVRSKAEREAQKAAEREAKDLQKKSEDGPMGLFKQMTAANLASMAIGYTIGKIVDAIHAAVDAAKQFGVALMDAFDFRRQAEMSLGILTGGSGRAALGRVKGLARGLGISSRDAAQQMQGLLGAGFSEAESTNFIKGLADLRALGISDQGVSGVQTALGQIKGKGVLSAEEINQIAENSGGLIGRGKIYEQVGRARGISAQEAMKLANTGKISGDEGVAAVLASIQATTGKSLGSLGASAAGKTFGGVGNKFSALGSEVLDRLILKSGPAMESMLKSLSVAADDAFKWLDSKEGTAFMQGIAEGLGIGAGPAVTNMENLATIIGSKEFAEQANGVGRAIGVIASSVIAMNTLGATIYAATIAPFTVLQSAIDAAADALRRLLALIPSTSLAGFGGGVSPLAPLMSMAGVRGPQPADFRTSNMVTQTSSPAGGTTNNQTNSFAISVQGGGNDEELAAKISRAVRREIQNMSSSLGV